MCNDLIKACLHQLTLTNLYIDETLVKTEAEETLKFGNKAVTLLLDGQVSLGQLGRFAYFEIDSKFQVRSFAVFERIQNFSVRELIAYTPYPLHIAVSPGTYLLLMAPSSIQENQY